MGATFEASYPIPIDVDEVLEFRWMREGHNAGQLTIVLRDHPRPEIYSIGLTGGAAQGAMAALATLFQK